jgi:hypothetical protein
MNAVVARPATIYCSAVIKHPKKKEENQGKREWDWCCGLTAIAGGPKIPNVNEVASECILSEGKKRLAMTSS